VSGLRLHGSHHVGLLGLQCANELLLLGAHCANKRLHHIIAGGLCCYHRAYHGALCCVIVGGDLLLAAQLQRWLCPVPWCPTTAPSTAQAGLCTLPLLV
jgi:hypothetical protein